MPRGNPGISSPAKSASIKARWADPAFRQKMRDIMHEEAFRRMWREKSLRSPEARFEHNVDKEGPNGCWIWTGAKTKLGYGLFSVNAKLVYVHRWSYERAKGPIPNGMALDHLCRNPSCANPDHLEAVPQRVNVQRGATGTLQKRATYCPKGHPFDDANTLVKKDGSRVCRICNREYQKEWARRQRIRKRECAQRAGT